MTKHHSSSSSKQNKSSSKTPAYDATSYAGGADPYYPYYSPDESFDSDEAAMYNDADIDLLNGPGAMQRWTEESARDGPWNPMASHQGGASGSSGSKGSSSKDSSKKDGHKSHSHSHHHHHKKHHHSKK